MLRHTFFLLFSLFAIPACQDYNVVEVKDFRIYADTQNPDLQHAIRTLANRYNKQMGSQALTIVSKPEDSNSRIRFTSGLQDDGHKLGLGKWITTSKLKSSFTMKGESNTETVAYAMDIEFDEENFATKSTSVDDSSSDEAQHLYHLFCHEVGHGLQMEHSNDMKSVMYPTIPDKSVRYVDFNDYFKRARSFLSGH